MVARTQPLLIGLALTTVVVTATLGWTGWRLLQQQRVLDDQRVREQEASAADALAARVGGRLAEAGERLSNWVASPASPLPVIDGAVVVATGPVGPGVSPSGGLPYVPMAPDEPSESRFAAAEALEFRGDAARAMAAYRTMASERDPRARAGALVRLGRVQRKLGDLDGALTSYERLAALGPVRTGEVPAELAALNGQLAVYRAMADHQRSSETSQRLLKGLDTGRWLIARGAAELYREAFSESRPASWQLAAALSEVWREAGGRLPSRGHRVFDGERSESPGVVVLWRSSGSASAALAVSSPAFFEPADGPQVTWQLVDSEGRVIVGPAAAPPHAVGRVIGSYPWTVRAWTHTPTGPASAGSRGFLLAMLAATLAFIWGAYYFMARAIRREAAVARLRSDFVAAVSHEFRSPLTALRQTAEMLEDDRVRTEEGRRKYYRLLTAETARLQRLVETLLDFGRMEAGGGRYRFGEVDLPALVREVVGDLAAQARAAGKVIETEGPEAGIRVRADRSALSVALRNLIDNAIKYSPGEPQVWVRWRLDHGRAVVGVVDRGLGISPAEHGSIFGQFVRGRAAIEANIGGTGVGLAIVKHIVQAHGGAISLESAPGRGSTFTLVLPGVS